MEGMGSCSSLPTGTKAESKSCEDFPKSSEYLFTRLLTHLLRELLRLGLDVLDGADHVERGLGEVIVRAREDLLEGADGVLEGDELALETSEDLRDSEGLRHETLDLTRTLDLSGGKAVSK